MTNLPSGLGEYKDTDLIAEMESRGYVVAKNACCHTGPNWDGNGNCITCARDILIPSNNGHLELDDVLSGSATHAAWWGFDKASDTPYMHTSSTREEALTSARGAILTLMAERERMARKSELCMTYTNVIGDEDAPSSRYSRVTRLFTSYLYKRSAALTPQSPTNKEEL